MTAAIEDWPTALQGVPPIETLTSGDGNRRIRFIRRHDGLVQFFAQELRRCETEGQEYFVWYCDALSGLYGDLETAKREVLRSVSWLQSNLDIS